MFTTYGKLRSEAGVNPVHDAIDIEGYIGETILAAADGVVFRSHWNNVGGNRIVIEHGQDADGNYLRTVYLHLTERSVEVGQKVKRGQLIGTLGVTGSGASGRVPHLHFSVYKGPTKEYSKQWNHANPHDYWLDGPYRITCYDPARKYPTSPIRFTYPVECKR